MGINKCKRRQTRHDQEPVFHLAFSAAPLFRARTVARSGIAAAADCALQNQNQMNYITEIPETLPSGEILVHNHVRAVAPLGRNGFRAWTEPLDPARHFGCDCEFGGLNRWRHPHYQIKLSV